MEEVIVMQTLDLIVRLGIGIIVLGLSVYVIPKIVIPDIIQEFKKTFKKPQRPIKRIEIMAYDKRKKKLWDTRSVIDTKV